MTDRYPIEQLDSDYDNGTMPDNVAALRAWIGPRVRLVAVVKAQGYGLGARLVGTTALGARSRGCLKAPWMMPCETRPRSGWPAFTSRRISSTMHCRRWDG